MSGIGDWLYLVALLVLVYNESNDPLLLGIVGGARIIPFVILSVPAGIIVDKYDRRIVLLLTDVARGLIMVALTALTIGGAGLAPIVALAIFATCFSTFFQPAIGAYVPMLVRDERELGPANSLNATLGELTFIIGPALAGIILAVTDIALAFAINAVTFAVVAIVLATLPSGKPGRTPVTEATVEAEESAIEATTAEAHAGSTGTAAPAAADASAAAAAPAPAPAMSLRAVARPLVGLMSLDTVAGFFFGGLSVLTVVLAVDRLGAGEGATGFLNAAVGVGGVVGAILAGIVVVRRNLGPVMLGGAIVLGVGFVIVGFSTTLPPALVGMAVIAGGALLADVVSVTVFQRIVPDEMRGRVIGGMQMLQTFTFALGSVALPALALAVGFEVLLPVAGVAIALTAVVAVVLIGGYLRQPEDAGLDVLVRVARLPILAGVPPAALELAASRLVPVPVTAGEVVIREGDIADRFYIIESGSFAVDHAVEGGAAPKRLRVMGADQVFGELGLMHGAPRSATVTAETDGRLLALAGSDFLELASSATEVSSRLAGLYRGPGTSSS